MLQEINCKTTREFPEVTIEKDIIVVGAGLAGICAALAAARSGVTVALVTDRPVLGGNASSEVRVTPGGASYSVFHRFAKETGLMEEFALLVARKASESGIWRWLHVDEIYCRMTAAEPNLEVFLNTTVQSAVRGDGGIINSVKGVQLRSERHLTFKAKYFIDCSGDGVVGYLAGADFRMGREARAMYHEQRAPEKEDACTMGASLLFSSVDRGHPVPFRAPPWAIKVEEVPTICDSLGRNFYRLPNGNYYGFWWAEVGGDLDSIHDDAGIINHCRRLVYGLWDHVKNSGRFANVEGQEIDWIGYLPGKRESRRLLGPYILTANDVLEQKSFPDAIGHCGWPVDIHPPKGYQDADFPCSGDELHGPGDIPLRCLFSRNLSNLFFAGRDISVSHLALGAVRVQATTAVMGQAAGAAAAYCYQRKIAPSHLVADHMSAFQDILMRQDQSIMGRQLIEKEDVSRRAVVSASSERALAITEGESWIPLDHYLGMVLPVVTPVLRTVTFYAAGPTGTSIKAVVYGCDKPQNYRLSVCLGNRETTIDTEGRCVFDVQAIPGPGAKVIMVLFPAAGVKLRATNATMTGVAAMEYHSDGIPDYNKKCNPIWLLPLFETEPRQPVFSASCINDGHIRPYGRPHLWASGKMRPGQSEWIEYDFNGLVSIRRVELVFNSNLNRRTFDAIRGMMDPELVRTYELQAFNDGLWKIVFLETDNIRRFRRHEFAPVNAEKLRLLIHATWGHPYAEVFDFRVYGHSVI